MGRGERTDLPEERQESLTDMFLESFVLHRGYQIQTKQQSKIKANIGAYNLAQQLLHW